MRTTVTIADDLLREAKRRALDQGTTLGAVLEEALRRSLRQSAEAAKRVPATRLTTFKGNGLRAGIDLDSSSALLDSMEGP